MDMTDVLSAASKLLGTYFGVIGLVELVIFVLRCLFTNIDLLEYTKSEFRRHQLASGSASLVYLAAAFVLIRHTDWWVGKLLGAETEESAEEAEPVEEGV